MRFIGAIALLVLGLGPQTSAAETAEQVKEKIQRNFQGETVENIRPSPFEGVYEVTLGAGVFYTDGRYLLQGDLYDLKTQQNLTKKSLVGNIPDDETIIFPAEGKSRHTLTIFTDTTCGYCRRLHQDVDKLNAAGITVRYLIYPRGGPGSRAARELESAWCSDDPQQALTRAKQGEKIPTKRCENPLKENIERARHFGLRGTPLIITDQGHSINGYKPADALIRQLSGQQ